MKEIKLSKYPIPNQNLLMVENKQQIWNCQHKDPEADSETCANGEVLNLPECKIFG